jgi:predicted DNA-binding transcriptional regulator YafY
MSTTNQTARVLELLKRFNNGEKVSIEALSNEALWYGKAERTIRRDLDVIKEYFPDSFELVKGEKGCYKAITKNAFDNFINAEFIRIR